MCGQDGVALFGRERVERRAEDVVLHAERHEPHHSVHVVRHLPRRVQGDGLPDRHDLLPGQATTRQEGAGGVRHVDLEALVLRAMAFQQADVVEHRADVEQLGVVVEAASGSAPSRPLRNGHATASTTFARRWGSRLRANASRAESSG